MWLKKGYSFKYIVYVQFNKFINKVNDVYLGKICIIILIFKLIKI